MSWTVAALALLGWLASPAAALRWVPFDDALFEAARRGDALVIARLDASGCAACAAQERALERLFPDDAPGVIGFEAPAGSAAAARPLGGSDAGLLVAFRGAREVLRATGRLSAADLDGLLSAARFPQPRGRALGRPMLRRSPRP